MRTRIPVLLAAAGLAAGAAVASAERLPGSDHGGQRLVAHLTGAAEVPGPGDPDGAGEAVFTFNHGQREVCWLITTTDIDLPAVGAHIHRGTADVAGPVVVPLTAPGADGTSSGCTTVSRELIDEIRSDPAAFYANVHTLPHRPGAVRGQLER